jgi:hypothetical protein
MGRRYTVMTSGIVVTMNVIKSVRFQWRVWYKAGEWRADSFLYDFQRMDRSPYIPPPW